MIFWQEGETREGSGTDLYLPSCVVYCVSMWPIQQRSSKKNTSRISVCHMQFFTSSVPWHILYIWRKDLQTLSCQICKGGSRGEEKCQLRPHGGTGGTKNHFVFPSCSYTEMQIRLLPHLSFHHRLWLNTYAFINTSFAMCSHHSRWLTEAYWIQNHIKISNNLWHTWRELKCNVQERSLSRNIVKSWEPKCKKHKKVCLTPMEGW